MASIILNFFQLAVAYAQRLKRRLASEISALAHSTAPEIAVQVPDAINFLSRTTQVGQYMYAHV